MNIGQAIKIMAATDLATELVVGNDGEYLTVEQSAVTGFSHEITHEGSSVLVVEPRQSEAWNGGGAVIAPVEILKEKEEEVFVVVLKMNKNAADKLREASKGYQAHPSFPVTDTVEDFLRQQMEETMDMEVLQEVFQNSEDLDVSFYVEVL